LFQVEQLKRFIRDEGIPRKGRSPEQKRGGMGKEGKKDMIK